MEHSAPNKRIPAAALTALIVVALLCALVGAYCGLCSWVKANGLLLPGTVAVDEHGTAVADLSRYSQENALRELERAMSERVKDYSLTISYGDQTVSLSGSLVDFSPQAAVERAMSVKGEQPFLSLGVQWLGLAKGSTILSVSSSALTAEGEREARRMVSDITRDMYVAPVAFTYEVKDESVEVVVGADGRQVDSDALYRAIQDALLAGDKQLTVTADPIPSEPLTGEKLQELVYVEPEPSTLGEDGKLTPTVVGRTIDPAEAQSILDAARPGQSCSIPLTILEPDLNLTEEILFRDVLSSVSSSLDGVPTRNHNVALSASSCNEKIIFPGEVFSYLDTIGDPSTSRGYQTSTGYQNGQTVEMEGGGVCQMSSSLYYCAVYANLEIVNRAAHAFSVGYLPNGLDATVYYPSLDFKFRNNTDYPIKVVAYVEDNQRLYVALYGTKMDDTYVTTDRYTLSSTPWTTVYRPDESIPLGTTKVSVTPYTGYEVEVYRCVNSGDGTQISRTYENYSRYAKRDRVVLFNPADAASLGLTPDGQPLPEPTEPTEPTAPAEPSPEPSEQTPEPSEPGTEQPEPGAEPGEPGTEQPEPGTEPGEPGTEQPEPGTEPGEPGTEQPEPGTEPGEPGTEQPEPGTEPGEPGTEQPEPGTEPTEPGTEQPKPAEPEPGPNEPGIDQPPEPSPSEDVPAPGDPVEPGIPEPGAEG